MESKNAVCIGRQNCWVTERRVLFVMSGHFGNEQPSILNFRHFVAQLRRHLSQFTEVRFASFLSDGFKTMAVINPLERKLAKRISVHLQRICGFLTPKTWCYR